MSLLLSEHGRSAVESLLRDASEELQRLHEVVGMSVGTREESAGAGNLGELDDSATQLAAVLQQWYFDGRFLEEDGTPRRVPLDGKISLATLVRDSGVPLEPHEVALRLLANNLIEIDAQQRFRPTTRVVGGSYEIRALNAVRGIVCALRTAVRNLADTPKNDRWFHRTATVNVSKGHLAELDAFVRDQGSVLLFNIDDWCSQRIRNSAPAESLTTVDINLYFTPVRDRVAPRVIARPKAADSNTTKAISFLPTNKR
jgi:hypothetical protein